MRKSVRASRIGIWGATELPSLLHLPRPTCQQQSPLFCWVFMFKSQKHHGCREDGSSGQSHTSLSSWLVDNEQQEPSWATAGSELSFSHPSLPVGAPLFLSTRDWSFMVVIWLCPQCWGLPWGRTFSSAALSHIPTAPSWIESWMNTGYRSWLYVRISSGTYCYLLEHF